jgi:hypothetical protein
MLIPWALEPDCMGRILDLLFISSAVFDMLLNLSVPQFPYQ